MFSNKNQEHAMFTPPPESRNESAISDSSNLADSGYFGATSFMCHRCSVSSTTSTDSVRSDLLERSTTEPVRVPTFVSQHPPPKLDAMHRTFPKPPAEPSIDELLELPPQKLSLRNHVKNARNVRVPVVDKAKEAKAFEDIKKALLLAHATMKKPQSLQ